MAADTPRLGPVDAPPVPRPAGPARRRPVNASLRISPFMRLARTHAASTAGDAMVAASLAGTIFFGAATSEARGQTFLYLLLTMAPFAVVAPLIGPALDRAQSGRRWIVIGSAVVRALLCLVLIGRTDSLLLYPVAFSLLVVQKGYGIARSSLVPTVVTSDEELVEANSKLQLLSGLMGFVGAAPAALLFQLFGENPAPALALALATFAATAWLGLRIPRGAVAPISATPEERAELRSVGVLLAAAAMGLLRGVVGFLTLYFAFHFREEEQLAAFGFVAAVSVGGTLLGSVVAPKLRAEWPEERMLISVLVMAVASGVLALLIGGILGAALLGGVVGVASTAGKLAFDSIVQRDAPDANRGRLFAKFETRFQLIWVLGAMLGLVPLDELRLSFLVVALVTGFAAFSYIVGLTAWRHRTGAVRSQYGPRAVAIDEAMTEVQAQARRRVRTSSRAVVSRVRSGSVRMSRNRLVQGEPDPDRDATRVSGLGLGRALPSDGARVSPAFTSPDLPVTGTDLGDRDDLDHLDDLDDWSIGGSPPTSPPDEGRSTHAVWFDADDDNDERGDDPASSLQFAPRPAPPPPPRHRGGGPDLDGPTAGWDDADDPTRPVRR